jgi:uncharacterized protein (DUF885 family)
MSVDVASSSNELLDLLAQEDPLNDAMEGYPHHADRLADLDESAQHELRDRAAAIAARMDTDGPDGDDWIDRAVVRQQAEALITRIDARLVEHTMLGYDHSALGRLLGVLPAARPVGTDQERNFLARLAAIPEFLEKAARRHRAGVASGRTPVAQRASQAIALLDTHLAGTGRDPFGDVPLSAAAATPRDRLWVEKIRPAFAAYCTVLNGEIAPHGRSQQRPGLCWVTDGERSYANLVRMHTTTARTPEQLHRTGVDHLEALADEYSEAGKQAFGLSDATAVRDRLRSDVSLRWRHSDEILAAARAAIVRAEAAARRWFTVVPAEPCDIVAAPEIDGPAGYYIPMALDGARPGTYFVNVGRPRERGRSVAEATAFHEGIPGHHLQFSIARGLAGLLPLRRLAWINSYIEGWGLYAERLASEMGLYSDPLAELGMLAQDSLRAARLVVDTGIHAFGWSRERAIRYLLANTLLGSSEAANEIDRYIEYPGQALSYLVGRLELERLRSRAQKTLGKKFDIKAFHDVVLGAGPLPMDVLDRVINIWSCRD